VGALVPELLLDARPTRMTNDADVTVMVDSLADFETLKDRLADFGFTRTTVPHRMLHRSARTAQPVSSVISSPPPVAHSPFGTSSRTRSSAPPFHSDRRTASWRFAISTSLHSSAIISPHRSPASPPRRTSR